MSKGGVTPLPEQQQCAMSNFTRLRVVLGIESGEYLSQHKIYNLLNKTNN